jgi:hypothetical protein
MVAGKAPPTLRPGRSRAGAVATALPSHRSCGRYGTARFLRTRKRESRYIFLQTADVALARHRGVAEPSPRPQLGSAVAPSSAHFIPAYRHSHHVPRENSASRPARWSARATGTGRGKPCSGAKPRCVPTCFCTPRAATAHAVTPACSDDHSIAAQVRLCGLPAAAALASACATCWRTSLAYASRLSPSNPSARGKCSSATSGMSSLSGSKKRVGFLAPSGTPSTMAVNDATPLRQAAVPVDDHGVIVIARRAHAHHAHPALPNCQGHAVHERIAGLSIGSHEEATFRVASCEQVAAQGQSRAIATCLAIGDRAVMVAAILPCQAASRPITSAPRPASENRTPAKL